LWDSRLSSDGRNRPRCKKCGSGQRLTLKDNNLFCKVCGDVMPLKNHKASHRIKKAHTDAQTLILDRDELSRNVGKRVRGTLCYQVKKVHATMNEYLLTWLAMGRKGKINMQEVIPVSNID
jgi:hypothetical protein